MKLLIDASCINRKNVIASIPNYIIRLIDGFLAYSSFEIILMIDYDFKKFFETKYPTIPKYFLKRNYFLYRAPILGEIYGRWRYKKTIEKIPHDAEIIASDLDRSTKIKPKHPRIQVIHDIKAIKDGNIFQKKRNFLFYKELINSATSVIAISDYTKNDILKNFNINESKISIIPNSVQTSNREKRPNQIIPKKFILYVNTLLPHKNPITLIKAYDLLKTDFEHKLVFVGKTTSYWEKKILPYLKKHNLLDRIIHFHDLNNEELQYLYNKASLFVSTSKREGFGYTPIEAAISKVPVICSTSEALPYSTKKMLNYYKPVDDYKILASKMRNLLKGPPSKELLNTIADKFKEEYSPQKQIERFCTLIKRIGG